MKKIISKNETSFGFQSVNKKDKAKLVRAIFDDVANKYDLMNDLMSFGVHRIWKSSMINWLSPKPDAHFLDVAGGTGDVALKILARLSKHTSQRAGLPQITVIDASEQMLGKGRDRAIDSGIFSNINWVRGDAEELPIVDSSIDFYTIAFGIRNVTNIEKALREASRVLRPGGRFICLEFSHVMLPALSGAYDAYSFRVLPIIGELVAGNKAAYQYLAESIRRFPDQETFAKMLYSAGLEQVKIRNLSGGIAALHSAWRI